MNQVTLHLLAKAVTATGTASSGGTIGASQKWAGAMATFKAASVAGGLMLAGPAAANYTLTGATGTATVTSAPSSLLLSSSANPSVQGSSVTFTATVSSGVDTPAGAVVFLATGVAFSTNILGSGFASAAYSLLPAGTNTIAAQFAAQGNYQASSASLQQVVRLASFVLSSTWNGSQLTLSWPSGGLLLEAPTLNGPWTTNTVGASFCTITPTGGMQFFRALVP